jgi:hypothetical protein
MLPGEGELKQRYVVLLEQTDAIVPEPGSAEAEALQPETWTYITRVGVMAVPVGTKRQTVLAKLLNEQGLEGSDVPQIELPAGTPGEVFLVPEDELQGWPVAWRARLEVQA